MVEYLYHVDEKDRVIGKIRRDTPKVYLILHRSVGILIVNSKNEILMHQRTFSKDIYPGYYDFFVGGGVKYGETYRQAALRETREETGANIKKIRYLFTNHVNHNLDNCFMKIYVAKYDGPIKFEKKEIIHGRFVNKKTALSIIKNKKTPRECKENLKKYFSMIKDKKI